MSDETFMGLIIGAVATFLVAFGYAIGVLRDIRRQLARIALAPDHRVTQLQRREPS